MAAILGGTTHTCDHTNNDMGCVAVNTSLSYWWIPCTCKRKYDCSLCNNTGKIYPDRCPVYYYDDELKTLRMLYENYTNKNILPYSGSLMEQPKKIMDVFDAINVCLYERMAISKEEKEITNDIASKINMGKRK